MIFVYIFILDNEIELTTIGVSKKPNESNNFADIVSNTIDENTIHIIIRKL